MTETYTMRAVNPTASTELPEPPEGGYTVRVVNPQVEEDDEGVYQVRVVNPVEDGAWNKIPDIPGQYRIVLDDIVIGHVTSKGQSWYAQGASGHVYGPFGDTQTAAKALYQHHTQARAANPALNVKKLKSKLLR